MARGIVLFGSAGSGKTTLGEAVAQKLDYPYYDIDNYIWKKDTAVPFTVMYSRDEKIGRLMHDISTPAHFVMAGSMDSFHAPFDPLFDLAVHIDADAGLRLERIHRRELKVYGKRILKGGDMYEEHQRFLDNSMRYETDGSPCLKNHLEWASSLPCKVMYLRGEEKTEFNAQRIVKEYLEAVADNCRPHSDCLPENL